jgi:hypothetical protein
MSKRATKLVVLGVVLLLALWTVAANIRKANSMADYSSHAALTAEICDRLSSIPAGQRFPVSLSELQLTYPDGGNSSLLTRFSYNSVGTGCTFTTSLRGKEFTRSYP